MAEGGEEIPLHTIDQDRDVVGEGEAGYHETSFGGDDDIFLARKHFQEEWQHAKKNQGKDKESQGLLVSSMADLKAQLINNARQDLRAKFPELNATQLGP